MIRSTESFNRRLFSLLQLGFDGVRVSGVEVITEGVANNTFLTFWQQNDVNLARGMDFQPRGTIFARLTHLQHAPFTYRIKVGHPYLRAAAGSLVYFREKVVCQRPTRYLFFY